MGVFVQDHVEIGNRVHVLLGGRLNSYDDSGLAGGSSLEGTQLGVTGRTGLVYKPRDFSNSFNRPSILAQTPGANGPHDPETATQVEFGAKTALTPELSLTAAAFFFAARAGSFPGQPRTFSALFTIGAFR